MHLQICSGLQRAKMDLSGWVKTRIGRVVYDAPVNRFRKRDANRIMQRVVIGAPPPYNPFQQEDILIFLFYYNLLPRYLVFEEVVEYEEEPGWYLALNSAVYKLAEYIGIPSWASYIAETLGNILRAFVDPPGVFVRVDPSFAKLMLIAKQMAESKGEDYGN